MRWKLLFIVSAIASLVGAGAAISLILFLTGSPAAAQPSPVDIIALSPLIIPVAIIIAASFFVYRHTAKRRKLQAMATALLSTILMLTVFFISMMFLRKRQEPAPAPQPTKIAFLSGQHT